MASKTKKTDPTPTSIGDATTTIARQLDRTRDLLAVRSIFSEPYQLGDVTVIAVARISGGAGGGGGEGTDDDQSGSGFGTGFGVHAKPVGVYRIRDGEVDWRPSVDVNQVIRGSQFLAGVAAVCLTVLMLRRR
jgi:uncharacterized spore protein YtfJ